MLLYTRIVQNGSEPWDTGVVRHDFSRFFTLGTRLLTTDRAYFPPFYCVLFGLLPCGASPSCRGRAAAGTAAAEEVLLVPKKATVSSSADTHV